MITAGAVVYLNGFSGVFLFDDTKQILEQPDIRQLWPPWDALSGRRPVISVSLALNYAIGGFEVSGYHLLNVAVHILAALTLFGVVRHTLLRPVLRARFGPVSPWFALAVALIWVVHPLQTQSVTYIIQRSEALMGLFFLLTLYCVIRGVDSSGRRWWYTTAVVCCALGMGSKAVTVTAPIVVLLYDRVFISKSLGELLRRRWRLYTGFAATWGVLWACGIVKGVLYSSAKFATVGFAFKGITPWQYASTQPGVILQYFKLAFWPRSLCLDYNWPVAQSTAQIVGPAAVVMALLVATVWALFRKPPLGFLGAWFFLILSPTSSFIPIRDLAFEHRMYLPLASIVVLGVVGGHEVITYFVGRYSLSDRVRRRAIVGLVVTIVASLGYGTVRRNRDYRSEFTMWKDVAAKRPDNPRGHNGMGAALYEQGKIDEAITEFRIALRIKPQDARVHRNLGNALSKRGDNSGAIRAYRAALRYLPQYALARVSLADALFSDGNFDEAIRQYRKALQINPLLDNAYHNLGVALFRQGDFEEGIANFREALRINPDYVAAHYNLGIGMNSMRKLDEAIAAFRATLRLEPDHAGARKALDTALHMQRRSEGD